LAEEALGDTTVALLTPPPYALKVEAVFLSHVVAPIDFFELPAAAA
jgi:hypothetical protein